MEKIRALLRLHPEGLSITSISSLSGVNRNTLVKYLEVLQSQGSVGMRQVGVAKVYYLADRIPVSAVRRFCRHYIILDHLLDVVETSASIPASLGTPARERTSRWICDQFPGLQGIANLEARLRSALRDEEQTVRWPTGKHPGERVYSVSFMPTVLESGRPAVSLVLNDVTESDDGSDGGELDLLRSQALFEDQSEYIVRLSPGGYVRWANPGYCRMTELTKRDLTGQRFQPPVAGDEREQWHRHLRSLTVEHPATTIESRICTRNGAVLWQRWTARALYASSGILLEYQLVGQDISEDTAARGEHLQHGEESGRPAPARPIEPRESKCRDCGDVACCERVEDGSPLARFAVENSTDGICWIDLSGRIVYANQTLCEDLGYLRDDLQSRCFPDIDARCDRESFERMWAALRREGRYSFGSMLRRGDGTLLPVETTARHLELNGLEYCCAYFRVVPEATDEASQGIDTTITPPGDSSKHPPPGDLVRMQETERHESDGPAARSFGHLLEEIMQDLPEAAFAVDCDGRVTAWNRAIETMTGISAADMLGKGNREYSLPFYRGRVPMLIDRVIGSEASPEDGRACSVRMEGNCLVAERAISLPDGYSRVILEKALPIRIDAGRVFGAIEFVHDITALRRTEELLKRERRFNTAVLEAIDALILIADDTGRIVWCNEQYRAWTEHTGHEPPGRGTHEVSGADPGDAGLPLTGPGQVKAGERLPIRWSRRTFVQPGTGRFDIYTGRIYPAAGEAESDPYRPAE